MQAVYTPYLLELKHSFSIAKFSRTNTPVILLKLSYEGLEGYGEASMVPYMGESFETAELFLKKVDWSTFKFPFDFAAILKYLDSLGPGQPAVKAAIDIALNDLNGKLQDKSCTEIYQAASLKMPPTCYTIGIDTPEVVREKVADAKDFQVIKVKLGRDNDKELINTIRSVSDLPLYVDANQGWTDKAMAIDLIYWLHDQGVRLIEQPMDKNDLWYNSLGASGAVSAVIFSYILFKPFSSMLIMPIPFGIWAVAFGPLYLVYCAYASKQSRDNINHDAHLYGALSGMILTTVLMPGVIPYFIEQVMNKIG